MNRLKDIVENFHTQSVTVLGDLILDKYLVCSVDRISPEAPVPIAKVVSEHYNIGGAGNVANNLSSLGVRTKIISVLGKDLMSKIIIQKLADASIQKSGLVPSNRQTTVKTRVVTENSQLLRIDEEETFPITKLEEKKVLSHLKELPEKSVLVISDYAKGLITEHLIKNILILASKKDFLVLVDPTPATFYKYKGSYLIKPNKKEAESLLNQKIKDDYSNLKLIGTKIKKSLRTKNLLITLGADGMAVFDSDGHFYTVKALTSQQVYDVTGAGDTVMATLAASLSSGASLREAVTLSNIAAGVVVKKKGTATVIKSEIIDLLRNEQN